MIEFTGITVQEVVDVFGELHEVRNIIENVQIDDNVLDRAVRKAAEQITRNNAHRELISISISMWKTQSFCYTGWRSVPNGTFAINDLEVEQENKNGCM